MDVSDNIETRTANDAGPRKSTGHLYPLKYKNDLL